jgi:hypothetical protein
MDVLVVAVGALKNHLTETGISKRRQRFDKSKKNGCVWFESVC